MRIPTIADLYLAFRQAKAALYYERRGVGLLEISQFEAALPARLVALHERISTGANWFDGVTPGEVWMVPKRLRDEPKADDVVHIGQPASDIIAHDLDVQMRLSPTPEFAILEVLYLREFGPQLETLLQEDVLGYRLDSRDGKVSPTRRWLFEYWPTRYREFRTAPLAAARRELKRDEANSVVILSADLASFYDTIDARFMLDDDVLKAVEDHPASESHVHTQEYEAATTSLLAVHDWFRAEVSRRTGLSMPTGVPIGALTSRIIANLALAPLDKRIMSVDGVVCYRRYVDDIVVVAREDHQRTSFDETLARLLPLRHEGGSVLELDVAALRRPDSRLHLQRKKIRIHQLSGAQGRDFVEAVDEDFGQLVSERRAFLDPTVLLEDGASRLMRVGRDTGSPLRVLRDADRARLEHFSLSTSLHSLERVSALVDRDQARRVVRRTLERAGRVMEAEDTWVENLDVALRVLKLAIATGDLSSCGDINQRMDRMWGSVASLRGVIKGLYFDDQPIDRSRRRPWVSLRDYLHQRRLEAVCSALPLDGTHASTFNRWLSGGLRVKTKQMGLVALRKRAKSLAASDLRARDREDDRAISARAPKADAAWMSDLLRQDKGLLSRLERIDTFIQRCRELGDFAWVMPPARLFLCTRPPSYFDIARRWLYRVEADGFQDDVFEQLLDVVNAVRGTEYSDPVASVVDRHTVELVAPDWPGDADVGDTADPRLILGNLVVTDDYGLGAATRAPGAPYGTPRLDFDRLMKLARVLKRATRVAGRSATGRPSVLVLPELSLPRQWFRAVANHVVRYGGFAMVAGLEYLHDATHPLVMNQAVAVLPGPFFSVVSWPWTKRLPAREEAAILAQLPVPVSFRPMNQGLPRTVVQSPWGTFSVLICSELIETRRVADLLGRVELVLCPAWNTDTASYDHLIQSVGLHLHSMIAIANNGYYSDCRAWAPLTERWRRDLCRLIERKSDDVVFVDLPLRKHRQFVAGATTHQLIAPCPTNCPHRKPPWRPLPPDWP